MDGGGGGGRLGSELLGYRLEGIAGRGGMGIVYRAYDPRLKRTVALKLLAPEWASDERFRERFLSETELVASLEHPNVVPIHDAGEVDDQLYLVMRLVDGGDVKQRLAEQGPLDPQLAISICSQAADALDAAHARGLVHRDVKPSNILLDGTGHVYLADFGLSRRLADQAPGFAQLRSLGTPAYVAPEAIGGGELDGRADQYSLACVLHECLTGSPPFPRESETAMLFAHLEEPPPATEGMAPVMQRALAKDPEGRYGSCAELAAAARDALGVGRARRRWPVALALASVVLLGVGGVAVATRDDSANGPSTTGRLVRIDPASNGVADVIPIGNEPSAVAVADSGVWVADRESGRVARIDPATGRVAFETSAHGKPVELAVTAGRAIVSNGPQDANVAVIDVPTGTDENVISLATGGYFAGSARIAAGASGIWLAGADRRIGRLDLNSAAVEDPVFLAPPADERSDAYFSSIAVADDAVWIVGDPLDRRLWRIDPATQDVVATIPLDFAPKDIAVGERGIWVTSQLDDTVSRVDPTTNDVTATVRVGRGASGVAVAAGSVWVANAIDETVSRIDPTTLRVTQTIAVDGSPDDVAAGDDGIWVTTRDLPVDARAEEDELSIGVLTVCEGVFGFLSEPSVAGGELALLQRGGELVGPKPSGGVTGATVAGKRVRLAFGCGDQTAETALSEARRLVEQAGVDVVIGPGYIGEGFAVRDYARERPGVTFVSIAPGHGTTMRDRAPNHFRFNPDGTQLMAGLGAYAYNELGWRTATTVADDQSFGYTQVAGFVAEFCALGGRIVERIWIPPSASYGPYVASAARSPNVDGYAMAGSFATTLAFAKGVPALRGNLARKVVGGILSSNFEGLGSQADRFAGVVFGMGVPGLFGPQSAEQRSWSRYLETFGKAFPELAIFGATGFPVSHTNAMEAVLTALEQIDGDLSDRQQRFRAALAELELRAPTGRLRLDVHRQLVAPNFLQQVVKGRNGAVTMATLRSVPGVEQTFNGYFRPSDPIIGRDTVECRRGNAPSWAR